MGYYVELIESTAVLLEENLAEAYERMCALNDRDDLKCGGSYGPNGVNERWFSWMDANYPAVCKDVKAVFEMLGFDVGATYDASGNEIGLHLVGYDNKTGQEDLFLDTVGDLLSGVMVWRGEDGAMWRETYDGTGRNVKQGRVVYDD